MKRHWVVVGTAVSLLLLQGCIQDDIRVTVRPDGTGTIEEKLLISNEVTEMLEGLGNAAKEDGPGGAADQEAGKEAVPEKRDGEAKKDGEVKKNGGAASGETEPVDRMMRQAAKKEVLFGEGVRFVSVDPEKTESATGYRAVYAFDDIRRVRIGKDRSRRGLGTEEAAGPAGDGEDAIRFDFAAAAADAPAQLTIRLPEREKEKAGETGEEKQKESPPAGGDGAPTPKPMDPQSLEMMQALFKGMRMSVSVRIEGAIVETNATWRRDADITLMDVNFERILENRELLEKMASATPDSYADMKALFHTVEGLKFELNNPVLVRFQ
jgi:hypothetical protein